LTDTLVSEFDAVEMLTMLTERSVALLDVSAAGALVISGDLSAESARARWPRFAAGAAEAGFRAAHVVPMRLRDQVIGVLAGQSQISPHEAFTVLRRYARDHGLRLTTLAGDIVAGATDLSSTARTAS
jgi:hypothetical protein